MYYASWEQGAAEVNRRQGTRRQSSAAVQALPAAPAAPLLHLMPGCLLQTTRTAPLLWPCCSVAMQNFEVREHTTQAPSKCPGGCNKRGYCTKGGDGTPACNCHRGWAVRRRCPGMHWRCAAAVPFQRPHPLLLTLPWSGGLPCCCWLLTCALCDGANAGPRVRREGQCLLPAVQR